MDKICKICGSPFKSARLRQVLCGSPICKKKNKNNNTKEHNSKRVLKTRTIKNCKVCNNPFETTENYNKITCSKKCSRINTNTLIPCKLARIKEKTSKKCKICKKDFMTARPELYRTCSKKCRKINRRQINLVFCQKRDGIAIKTKQCVICCNNFNTFRKDGQILACSKKCQKIYRLNWNRKYLGVFFINKKCVICKKEFNTTEKGHAKTCSKNCSKEMMRRNDKVAMIKWRINNPERRLEYNKKSLDKLGIPFKLPSWRFQYALSAWSKVIRDRDTVCVICGSTDRLNAHHLIHRSIEPKLSFNINNGILLCQLHHYEVHNKKY